MAFTFSLSQQMKFNVFILIHSILTLFISLALLLCPAKMVCFLSTCVFVRTRTTVKLFVWLLAAEIEYQIIIDIENTVILHDWKMMVDIVNDFCAINIRVWGENPCTSYYTHNREKEAMSRGRNLCDGSCHHLKLSAHLLVDFFFLLLSLPLPLSHLNHEKPLQNMIWS